VLSAYRRRTAFEARGCHGRELMKLRRRAAAGEELYWRELTDSAQWRQGWV